MLDRLATLSPDVLNIIVYVESAALRFYIQDAVKRRFGVEKEFAVTAHTAKALINAKGDTVMVPLRGQKWMINVEADDIPLKDLLHGLDSNTAYGVTVYWIAKYSLYKKLVSANVVKNQGVYCFTMYAGRLGYYDIKLLYRGMVGERAHTPLSDNLLNFVAKSYTYDVQAVCDLFTAIRSGAEVSSKRDVVELVGIGGNTVDSFVIKLLTAKPKTLKGTRISVSHSVQLLRDLGYSYSYETIFNYMRATLTGIQEIKQLQMMGKYQRWEREIPENYDSKRIGRLRRFERVIMEEISLAKVLNLKLCMEKYGSKGSQELALIAVIYEFLNLVYKESCRK